MSRILKSHKTLWTNLAAVAAVAVAITLIAVKNQHADVLTPMHNVSYSLPGEPDHSGSSAHLARALIGAKRPAEAIVLDVALKPRTP